METSQKLELNTEQDTYRLANTLSSLLQPGDIVFLQGDLGSGKTTFARYFIQSLSPQGEQEHVPSPTFTLVQGYSHLSKPVWHFDLYRLDAIEEVWELGLEEALAYAITLVEWPEKLEAFKIIPTLTLQFELLANQKHVVTISSEDSDLIGQLKENECR